MRDIQNEEDTRKVPLQKVGVRGVKYPVTVLDKNRKTQNTTACVDLFVNLPHNFKGTHMSRFIEVFHKYHSDITMQHFLDMLEEMRTRLDAQMAYGRIEFPYFIEKKAPVTGAAGIMEYTCAYEGEVGILLNKSEKTVQRTIFSDLNDKSSLAPAGKPSSATPSAGSNAARNACSESSSTQNASSSLSWEEQKKLEAARRKAEKEVAQLEAKISELEEKKSALENKMADPAVYSNGEKAKAVQREIEELAQQIEETTAAWEIAAEKLG